MRRRLGPVRFVRGKRLGARGECKAPRGGGHIKRRYVCVCVCAAASRSAVQLALARATIHTEQVWIFGWANAPEMRSLYRTFYGASKASWAQEIICPLLTAIPSETPSCFPSPCQLGNEFAVQRAGFSRCFNY